MRICSVPGCGAKHDAKGFCHPHYQRFRIYGNPVEPMRRAPDGSGEINRGYRILRVNGIRKREHIIVAEKAFGGPLPENAVVHHVDENRSNNANSNLVICPDDKYHKLLHVRMNAAKACGNPNFRKCPYCKIYDDPANMRGEKSGRFVHRECSAEAQRNATKKRRDK